MSFERREPAQEAVLQPLRADSSTLSEQVYSALLAAILERRFKPGDPLPLDDLAARLRVSRTPVRDALSRLTAEGLVRSNGRRGSSVTVLAAADVSNLFELRLMCELFAVDKGLRNVTPLFVERLEQTLEDFVRLVRLPDTPSQLQSALKDGEFHSLIVGLAGNPLISDVFERLNVHLQCARIERNTGDLEERSALARRRHAGIVAALRLGDASAAKEAVRWHIEDSRDRMIALL